MVRVDAQDQDGKFKPLAAFSSFSMHNTTIAAPVDIYNGDVFGFAQRDLEWAMTDKYQPSWQVVSALTNGTHGDMAPNVHDEGDNWVSHYPVEWKVSSELGHKLGAASIELFNELEPALTGKVTLASAARELNIREHNRVDGIELCKDAAVGTPVAAGAYERRTPWLTLMPFFHGGNFMTRRTFFKDGCQGTKQHLGFAYLQPLLEPKDSFPNTVMFQILRINDMVVLPLPFEVTVESGRRIAKAVDDVFAKAGQAPKYTWVASVSNGYFGYTTTPEEYAYQNYEGGHTLYGKNNTPYLAAQLQHLAQDYLSEGSVAEMKPNWDYLLTVNNFYPEAQEAKGQRALLSQPETVLASKARDEDYVRVQWLDVNASQINLHQALVQVEKREGQAWVPLIVKGNRISDEGYDIEVRHVDEAKDGMAKYETRWYNPASGGEYRFVIASRANQPALYSNAFRVDAKAQVALLND
jgi:neutral ceramidase